MIKIRAIFENRKHGRGLNDRFFVAYLRFQMILSAIFVMLCLCDICCYVDKKQNRRLGRLVEPSGLINNHTERPLRTRNQSKMSHFVATVWFTSVNKVRVCIIISLFLFTKGTLYSHSGFEKFEKKKTEITMKFSLFKIMIFGKFLGEFFGYNSLGKFIWKHDY